MQVKEAWRPLPPWQRLFYWQGQQHAKLLILRPLCVMRSFREEEVTSEELSTMGRSPEEPPGSCSPEDQIQSVSMGLPNGQEKMNLRLSSSQCNVRQVSIPSQKTKHSNC